MSQTSQETFQCPNCGTNFLATLWQSVNVTLDPELKEKLFSRELFETTCPECGETTALFYPLLYHDQDAQVMVWLVPPDERGESRLDPVTMNAQTHLFPGYRLRLAASINELLEKIMIFDQDLDDRVVELMKELLWQDGACDATYPRNLFFFSQVVVDPEGERHLELVQLQPPKPPYAFRVGWEHGYQVVQELLYGAYGIPRVEGARWKRVDGRYAREMLNPGE